MADYKLFQSTLPWRERRDYLQGNPRGYNISIHAPAEERLEIQMPFFSGSPISIHAPAEGTTNPIYNRLLF